jgi:hypothetical protein
MMAVYSKELLSGSTSGRPILIAATATPGTLLHTAIAGATSKDEIYLWFFNSSGSSVNLTVEWGGVTDPGDLLVKEYVIPAKTTEQVSFGQPLNGGLVVRAFAATTNVITCTGYVNRYTV